MPAPKRCRVDDNNGASLESESRSEEEVRTKEGAKAIVQGCTMAHPKSSATQQRKNIPRIRLGRLAILCSFLRVRFVSSSLVFA